MDLNVKRYFFVVSGFFFLLLGLIGIILPILPTTPFLLLAALCFSKGSEKFYGWLMTHPVLSPPILDWQRHRAIRTPYKIMATAMMLVSCGFIIPSERIPLIGRGSFGVFILGVLVFIWTRKSRR